MILVSFWLTLVLLLHTYVLYPLLAGLLRHHQVRHVDSDLPSISVIVPAHNEAAVLEAKIQNFHDLDYPSNLIELLIFDDGSSDGTANVARANTNDRVRFYSAKDRQGKASAVNRLVSDAAHQNLLLTDANVTMDPGSVRCMVKHLSDPNVGAVTGIVRLIGSDKEFRSGESLYYQLERRIQQAESSVGSVIGVDGAMYVLRRELFEPLPQDTILDDFLISMNVLRSAKRIIFEPTATATETGTLSARQEFNRRIRIAAGAVQLLRRGNVPRWNQYSIWLQFLSHKLLRWASPILIAVLLACSFAIASISFAYEFIFYGELVGIAIAAVVSAVPKFRATSIGSVVFYFSMSQVAIAIGLGRGLLNRQPPQWEKAQRVNRS
ncbi:MAG: glycosyltransferase family 2 protein [Rubripirellula sp.]